MVDPVMLAAFVPAALALNLTPGADMIFCIGQGVRSGAKAAWAASAGIMVGGMVHVAVAGAGLSALLLSVPVAFDVIRWVGVMYLLWLAGQALFAQGKRATATAPVRSRAFRSGLLVNLTNPKVILFVLALIPQFVVPEAGAVFWQFMIFGGVIGIGGLVINGVVGMSAGRLGNRLAAGSRMLDIVTAGIFSALALKLALFERG